MSVTPEPSTEPLLALSGLTLSLDRHHGGVPVVDGVSLELERGGALGIVGESGSGKSLTLRALIGLLPAAIEVTGGTVSLGGETLGFSGRNARSRRRRRMAMVFQDSLSALDPVYTVGAQISEVLRTVMGQPRRQAWERAVELLDLVGIRDPQRRAHAYPHELSGGMRQRAMLAVALATEPEILLCDEPTTALDVTVQAQVLTLLDDLRRDLGLALVFVSHDLAVVRQLCEKLIVMYSGRVVESGLTSELLATPLHPYTRGLLAATLDLDRPEERTHPIPGSIPEPGNLPSGCSFRTRCSFAIDQCAGFDMHLEAVDAEGPNAEPAAGDPLTTRTGPSKGTAPRLSACLRWQDLVER